MADYTDFALASYNMLGQLGTAAMSYGTHKADRKFNAAQAELNREWQEKMWNLANEYNHPQQQMQRLMESGLNPALVYGDGATTLAAHVGNVGNASAPADNIKYPDLTSALMSALVMGQTKAQTSKIEAEELLTRETAKKVQEETKEKVVTNMWLKDSYQLRLDQLEAENNLKSAFAQTEVSKRNEIQANIEHLEAQNAYLESEAWNKTRLTTEEIRKMEVDIDNSIKQTAALVCKLEGEARKANAEAWLASAIASVKDAPEYKQAEIRKMVNEAYNAMIEGNQLTLEYRLKSLVYDQQPKPGEASYEWQKWWRKWVTPATESIGHVFGGNVGISKKM